MMYWGASVDYELPMWCSREQPWARSLRLLWRDNHESVSPGPGTSCSKARVPQANELKQRPQGETS